LREEKREDGQYVQVGSDQNNAGEEQRDKKHWASFRSFQEYGSEVFEVAGSSGIQGEGI
jgi:hypothetical protein